MYIHRARNKTVDLIIKIEEKCESIYSTMFSHDLISLLLVWVCIMRMQPVLGLLHNSLWSYKSIHRSFKLTSNAN